MVIKIFLGLGCIALVLAVVFFFSYLQESPEGSGCRVEDVMLNKSESAGPVIVSLEPEEASCERKFLPARGDQPGMPALTEPHPAVLKAGKVFLEGWVINDHQLPVAGAAVHLSIEEGSFEAETTPDGTFRFSCLAPPAFPQQGIFKVDHPLYCFLGEGRITAIPENVPPVTLMVHRWARLRVLVREASGRSLDHVRLELAGPPGASDRLRMPGIPEGGRIRVRRLVPGEGQGLQSNAFEPCFLIETVPPVLPLWLVAEHAGFCSKEVEIGAFAPDEERQVLVCLSETVANQEMTFKVQDPEGRAVIDAEAYCRWSPAAGKASQNRIKVDNEGVFKVTPPSVRWNLLVTAPGYAPLREVFPAGAQQAGMVTLTMVPSESEILVLVQDPMGRPVPDLRITLEDQRLDDGDYWKNLVDWGSVEGLVQKVQSTDPEGKARFKGLDPGGRYTVNVGSGFPGHYLQGRYDGRQDVPSPPSYHGVGPGDSPLRFRLVPPSSLQGCIRRADGLEGRKVFLSAFDPHDSEAKPLFTIHSILGSEGEFIFDGLPSGRFHLYVKEIPGGDDFSRPLAVFHLGECERLCNAVIEPP